jgi:hypothetical protein
MKNINKKAIVAVVVGIVLVGGYFSINAISDNNSESTITSRPITGQAADLDTDTSAEVAQNSTQELLLYLIEEEKLAHDVYTAMYQKYGANVFGNILESESTHQARVLTLLQARNIPDPRSAELGVFKNQELQKLYNQLIERGNKSAVEAYKVGVAIEEKDIADISTQLATATDQDVIATLESLRSASENHLRAFNRQL